MYINIISTEIYGSKGSVWVSSMVGGGSWVCVTISEPVSSKGWSSSS